MAVTNPSLVSAPRPVTQRTDDIRPYAVHKANEVSTKVTPPEADASGPNLHEAESTLAIDEGNIHPAEQDASADSWVPKGLQLLADTSFSPIYNYHYASTLYAFVSFLPWKWVANRARVNLLA